MADIVLEHTLAQGGGGQVASHLEPGEHEGHRFESMESLKAAAAAIADSVHF